MNIRPVEVPAAKLKGVAMEKFEMYTLHSVS